MLEHWTTGWGSGGEARRTGSGGYTPENTKDDPAKVRSTEQSRPEFVEVLRAYSNRSELLEQLHETVSIMIEGQHTAREVKPSVSRRLRDRLTPEDVETIINLRSSGTPINEVAERFGITTRSVTRLITKHR